MKALDRTRISKYSIATSIITIFFTVNLNATIIRDYDGIDNLEWLELTETAGMSRNEVEDLLQDPHSTLYGYRYASKAEVSSLLDSYTLASGIDPGSVPNWSGYFTSLSDMTDSFLHDFGSLYSSQYRTNVAWDYGANTIYFHNNSAGSYFLYGDALSSPYQSDYSYYTGILQQKLNHETVTGYHTSAWLDDNNTTYLNSSENAALASMLVRNTVVAPVPEPATMLLFGTGIIGIAGLMRRKNRLVIKKKKLEHHQTKK